MALSLTPNVATALIFIGVGAFIAFLARFVRNGNVEILAGYDAARVTDKAGLAAWAGSNLLLLGNLQMASGLLMTVNLLVGALLFGLATLVLSVRSVSGCQRFYR